ncbi:DNA repair protein RecO [Pleionea sp. CnH1-48]|uniref:DNA repair protein RecO n=1 Tax=Pleionea sp. CnH1-48 TaxID=2954494 RepID=UPI0020980402|nr:DNA repair protein RecO [Pleionea sp. CnH1-48]MCO7225464.1 DNA repair protein RecO [Pleionea sp. CnH1-48]
MRLEEHLIVLHARPYQETALMVDAFSKEHGRLTFIAKHIRSPSKQKVRAALQTSAELEAVLGGKGEVKTLQSCEVITPAAIQKGEAFICCSYISELLLRTLPRWEPNPSLYDYIRSAFESAHDDVARLISLRLLELKVIESLGYGIQFNQTIEQQAVVEEFCYLVTEQGFRAIDESSVREPSRLYVSGLHLLQIFRGELQNPSALNALKQICRVMLTPHLGNKPLVSRKLWLDWHHKQSRAKAQKEESMNDSSRS